MKSALADLYRAHVAERQRTTERALSETGFDRLLLHSGVPFTYFADDNDAPFHPTPHFAHWAPVEGPGHVLEVRPGTKPRLVRYQPRDYWYAPPQPAPDFVAAAIEIVETETPEAVQGRSAKMASNDLPSYHAFKSCASAQAKVAV